MYHNIPNISDAAAYARADMQQLTHEILRLEGMRTINRMAQDL